LDPPQEPSGLIFTDGIVATLVEVELLVDAELHLPNFGWQPVLQWAAEAPLDKTKSSVVEALHFALFLSFLFSYRTYHQLCWLQHGRPFNPAQVYPFLAPQVPSWEDFKATVTPRKKTSGAP
jgi:hypothetical protein